MRIFYASDTTPNSEFESNIWRDNLYLSLLDLGHDVIEFNYDLQETFQNLDPADPGQKDFIRANRPKLTSELLKQLKASQASQPIDLFFSYFYDACILPEGIEKIKSMGIKTVNWYCNGSYQLKLVSEISPHYDWCLVPEKFRLKDYVEMGARPIYCQEAANPNIYKPYHMPIEFDVTFIGQAYGDRPAYIQYLLGKGIDVRVWGWGWKPHDPSSARIKRTNLPRRILHFGRLLMRKQGWQWMWESAGRIINQDRSSNSQGISSAPGLLPFSILGGTLSDLEMIQMYSRTKINLGFSSCGNTHESGERILQVRLRDFEVPMSGGFYMVEYMAELEEFFDIGKEIVCYKNKEDLADKIKYYLTHDDERERIRQAGYKRAQRDHTWQKRFKIAFQEMDLTKDE